MAKTWENFACVFYTQNTLNNYGDSKYTVTKDKMTRHAPVNKDRAPDQVNTGSPAIAYLDPKSNLYKAIKAQRDDRKIMIEDVVGDTIRVKVIGVSAVAGADPFIGDCCRLPANGYHTFDFVNNNGVLSRIHIGHELMQLTCAWVISA